MRDKEKLEDMANKKANSIWLTGIIFLITSSVATLSYSTSDRAFWDLFTIIMSAIGISGLTMIICGDIFYRTLLKYGHTTKRMFFFKDEE